MRFVGRRSLMYLKLKTFCLSLPRTNEETRIRISGSVFVAIDRYRSFPSSFFPVHPTEIPGLTSWASASISKPDVISLLKISSLAIVFLALCHTHETSAQNARTVVTQPVVNNEFAWKLFKNSKPVNRNAENFVLSPISVQLLLSLLQVAADGETKEQLKQVINNAVAAQLYSTLNPEGPEPEVKSANGIFVDSNERVKENVALQIYINGGDVHSVPFLTHSALSKAHINQFVSNATSGHIPDLLTADVDLSRIKAMLVSAVYFRSTWRYQFRPSQPRKFYTFFNEGKPTDFMEVEAFFKVKSIDLGKNVHGTMIILPYKNNTYSMYVIVPGPGITLNKFLSSMDHNTFTQVLRNKDDLVTYKVHLSMPKFKVSSRASFLAPLQKMGLVNIFSATKSGITNLIHSPEPIRINDIIQQSRLEVDESGTIATSATASLFVPLSANEPESKDFIIDKPFISVIVDNASEIPLFIAKIVKPSEV